MSLIATWTTGPESEQAMEDGHDYLWNRLIDVMREPDLAGNNVLDFGCNQGRFLRLLHDRRGFGWGLGVDIAGDAVAVAKARVGDRPIDYRVVDRLEAVPERFTFAFSHEVLYLLADIDAHARAMVARLAPGGVYYAVLGAHADNPAWPRWAEEIPARTTLPVHGRPLGAYARSFEAAGFRVRARPLGVDGFAPVDPEGGSFASIVDWFDYLTRIKIVFRLERP